MNKKNNIILVILFHLSLLGCQQNKNNTNNYDYQIKGTVINGIPFLNIPLGNFIYGIDKQIRRIDYSYWIMKYEVTNQEYYNFLNQALKNNFLQIKKDTIILYYEGDKLRPAGDYTAKILDDRIYLKDSILVLDSNYSNHPVTEVTWFGCIAFCNWYKFQLPDEFEWEKAARGMTGWDYPWGDTLESNRANYHNSGDPFDNGTTPVGFYNGQNYKGYQTKDSPSPYGCYDMAGNAWEYTNTTISPDLPYLKGGGGGFLYHTGAMLQSWYRSSFGYPIPNRIDRPFKSDGFRCIIK